MNGKYNIFFRCIICLLAYFYSLNVYAVWYIDLPSDGRGCKDAHIPANNPDNRCEALKSTLQRSNWRIIQPDGRLICQLSNPDNIPDSSPRQSYEFFGCNPESTPTPAPTPVPTATPKDCSQEKGKLVNAAVPNKGDACISQCRARQVVLVQQCNGPVQANGERLCLGGWAGQFRFDGARCNGSETGVPEGDWTTEGGQLTDEMRKKLSPYDCAKKGMASGEVNGQTVCLRKDGTSDLKTSEIVQEEKTNPDGSKTSSTKETQTTDDGVKIKKEENETKQEFNPDGTPKAPPTKASGAIEKDKGAYCKENPNDNNCKAGTINGECDKPFKCEGDVIACESTKFAFLRYCDAQKAEASETAAWNEFASSDMVKAGKQAMDASNASGIKSALGLNGENSIDLSKAIKQEGFLSCAQGLSDKTFNVFGKSITLEFSKMNYFLAIMGKIAVLFSLIAAAGIIVRGRS